MEIIQIIFILGIISFIMIQKVNKSFKTTDDTINPNIPDVPPYEIQETQAIQKEKSNLERNNKINKSIAISSSHKKDTQKKDIITSNNKKEMPRESKKENISLSNVSEAKKAFIYSEIFRRKY